MNDEKKKKRSYVHGLPSLKAPIPKAVTAKTEGALHEGGTVKEWWEGVPNKERRVRLAKNPHIPPAVDRINAAGTEIEPEWYLLEKWCSYGEHMVNIGHGFTLVKRNGKILPVGHCKACKTDDEKRRRLEGKR